MRPSRSHFLFAYVCVIWGSTWIAMKYGTAIVPPGMFSGLRWTAAGLILLGWVWLREGRLRLPWHLTGRVLAISFLLNTANQLFMLYGLRMVGSGLASVINSAFTPLSLLGFAVVMRQERITQRTMLAMGLGVAGILMLFGPAAVAGRLDGAALLGAAFILFGTLTYCFGSVMARPLMGTMSPLLLAGMINLAGGLSLLLFSLLVEPDAFAALNLQWGWVAWSSWLFLLGPAALGASTIFLVLVRDWGASKAGSYAFISPVIAVLLGIFISHEGVHPVDGIGMALMMCGAWVALRKA